MSPTSLPPRTKYKMTTSFVAKQFEFIFETIVDLNNFIQIPKKWFDCLSVQFSKKFQSANINFYLCSKMEGLGLVPWIPDYKDCEVHLGRFQHTNAQIKSQND